MNHSDEATLLHRALSRTATLEEWDRIHSLSLGDPGIWKRLAQGLHDEALVRGAVDASLAPSESARGLISIHEIAHRSASQVISVSRRWAFLCAGLLMVASLGIGGAISFVLFPGVDQITGSVEVHVADEQPSDAGSLLRGLFSDLDAAIEKNLLPASLFVPDSTRVREFPPVLMERRSQAGTEGLEVLVMRCFVERKRVDELYELGLDEYGVPEPVAVKSASLSKSISF